MTQQRSRVVARLGALAVAGGALAATQIGVASGAFASTSTTTISVKSMNIDPLSPTDSTVEIDMKNSAGTLPNVTIRLSSLPHGITITQLPTGCTRQSATVLQCDDLNSAAEGGSVSAYLSFGVPQDQPNSGPITITASGGGATATGTVTFDRVTDFNVVASADNSSLDKNGDFVSDADPQSESFSGLNAGFNLNGPDPADPTLKVVADTGATIASHTITLLYTDGHSRRVTCVAQSSKQETCDLGMTQPDATTSDFQLFIPAHATSAPETFTLTASSANLQDASSSPTKTITFDLKPDQSTGPTGPAGSGSSTTPASAGGSRTGGSDGQKLAETGASNVPWLATGAGVLLVGGGAGVVLMRRRRTGTAA